MAKKNKFEFGIDFQQLILQYTVTDRVNGPRVIKLYDDTYFALIPHAVIAFLLKKFFKKRKRIPSETVLREQLRVFYKAPKSQYPIEDDDKKQINTIISEIYREGVRDGDEILKKCIDFARFISFSREMENVDINNYDSYSGYADKLKKAQNIGADFVENAPVYLVAGAQDRLHNRDKGDIVFPTPFRQFNNLLNAGGTTKGNMIMFVSQAKRFKTGTLVNVALGYMKLRKKVLYADFENGKDAITTRGDQSIMGAEQNDILDGKLDTPLGKVLRRYRRIGAEMVIQRFNAYKDTAEDVRAFMHDEYLKTGIIFNVIIADYLDLSGTTAGHEDDTKRIDTAYVEWKNMADQENIEALYTASHVTREAGKRRGTRYEQNDLAKCIDKIRHADVAIGIQENENEIEAKVHRWEIIDQRNGKQGKMMFWVNIPHQKIKEFTKAELKDYLEQAGESDEPQTIKKKVDKKDRKTDM